MQWRKEYLWHRAPQSRDKLSRRKKRKEKRVQKKTTLYVYLSPVHSRDVGKYSGGGNKKVCLQDWWMFFNEIKHGQF